jgi:DNA-binding IclR family transcriptional regulator
MTKTVQSVERAAAVLRLLGGGQGHLGCVDVANSLGLAKGTAHGLLRTLQHVGFVEQDAAGRYLLGPALRELCDVGVDPHVLRSAALNWTDALAARSGATVRLGVLDAGEVLVASHCFRPGDPARTLEVGAHRPAHACALGKVLLAYSAGAAAAVLAGPLTSYTPRTCTDRRGLAQALEGVRRAGWAVETEELAMGTAGLAAPVRAPGGFTVAAVGITGDLDQLCESTRAPRPHLLALVMDTARAITRELATA